MGHLELKAAKELGSAADRCLERRIAEWQVERDMQLRETQRAAHWQTVFEKPSNGVLRCAELLDTQLLAAKTKMKSANVGLAEAQKRIFNVSDLTADGARELQELEAVAEEAYNELSRAREAWKQHEMQVHTNAADMGALCA